MLAGKEGRDKRVVAFLVAFPGNTCSYNFPSRLLGKMLYNFDILHQIHDKPFDIKDLREVAACTRAPHCVC